jgi:peptide deformylase
MNFIPAHSDLLWSPAVRMSNDDRVMHQQTFKKLHDLNIKVGGAGIAFPQVGLHMAAFISRYEGWPVCVNPEFRIVGSDRISRLEGCLSRPGWHTYVSRPAKVYAMWDDVDGFSKTKLLDGIEARVFQHLCDLLKGQPIFPRPSPPKRHEAHV